jgi:hypothetical protein
MLMFVTITLVIKYLVIKYFIHILQNLKPGFLLTPGFFIFHYYFFIHLFLLKKLIRIYCY